MVAEDPKRRDGLVKRLVLERAQVRDPSPGDIRRHCAGSAQGRQDTRLNRMLGWIPNPGWSKVPLN